MTSYIKKVQKGSDGMKKKTEFSSPILSFQALKSKQKTQVQNKILSKKPLPVKKQNKNLCQSHKTLDQGEKGEKNQVLRKTYKGRILFKSDLTISIRHYKLMKLYFQNCTGK